MQKAKRGDGMFRNSWKDDDSDVPDYKASLAREGSETPVVTEIKSSLSSYLTVLRACRRSDLIKRPHSWGCLPRVLQDGPKYSLTHIAWQPFPT